MKSKFIKHDVWFELDRYLVSSTKNQILRDLHQGGILYQISYDMRDDVVCILHKSYPEEKY